MGCSIAPMTLACVFSSSGEKVKMANACFLFLSVVYGVAAVLLCVVRNEYFRFGEKTKGSNLIA